MALFTEFKKASYEDWLEQLKKELKGADHERFVKHKLDEIDVPTYLSATETLNAPSPLPYKKRNEEIYEGPNSWTVCAEIDSNDLPASNKTALQLLEHGANALRFTGIGISNQDELRLILKGIRPDLIHTHFDCAEANPALLYMFLDELQKRQIDPNGIKGSLGFDPFGDYAFQGSLASGLEETIEIGRALVQTGRSTMQSYQVLTVNGSQWYNSGAGIAGELAYTLACVTEYLCRMGRPQDVAASLAVRMASGADFFAGMAKFRSLRLLWARMLSGFSLDAGEFPLWISAETGSRNKTLFDPWNNQLRATTEAMAAVIGGADELTVHPYDAVFRKPDAHSKRIALNVHHILRYESHLDAVADAAAGAGYIEKLTESLTEAAWDEFLQIEKKGGFLASFKKGWIQEQVSRSRKQSEQDFRKGKKALVGTNRFANTAEKVDLQPQSRKDPLSKLPEIIPVETYRESALLEDIRQKLGRRNPLPQAFLAMTGNPKRAADRATFGAEFMAMAGIESVRGEAGVSLIDQLHSKHARQAFVIVLCAADEDYVQAVETMKKDTWPPIPVLIAGRPAEEVELLAGGIDGFIYLGCDALPLFYKLTESKF